MLDDGGEKLNLRSRAKEKDHDEGMREADLGAIDDTVANGLDEGEGPMVAGVQDDALERGLVELSASKDDCADGDRDLESLEMVGHACRVLQVSGWCIVWKRSDGTRSSWLACVSASAPLSPPPPAHVTNTTATIIGKQIS